MELFGVGAGEALLVLVVTLLVVGPQRFPEIAREGGKYFRMARRFTAEVMDEVKGAINELEQEVNADELKAVRELGAGLDADMRRIGSETDAAASLQTPADEVQRETAVEVPAATEPVEAQPLGERIAAEAASAAAPDDPATTATSEPAAPAPWPPSNIMDQIRASYSWVTQPNVPQPGQPVVAPAPNGSTSTNGGSEPDPEAEPSADPEATPARQDPA
jgi:sec-independent protein translocase protein TatB